MVLIYSGSLSLVVILQEVTRCPNNMSKSASTKFRSWEWNLYTFESFFVMLSL